MEGHILGHDIMEGGVGEEDVHRDSLPHETDLTVVDEAIQLLLCGDERRWQSGHHFGCSGWIHEDVEVDVGGRSRLTGAPCKGERSSERMRKACFFQTLVKGDDGIDELHRRVWASVRIG